MAKKEETKEKITPPRIVTNCLFTGVHWDAKAVEGINDVARALRNLTELYKSQNIHIDALLKP
jgi:hypothetical protein